MPHCAVQSCKVRDYDVPRSSLVLVNVHAIGRDPKTWEDPLGFKPERFLGKNLDVKGTHYELLPFGGGRRICIGIPLALKQIQLILASLVYAFEWSLPLGMDPIELDMSDKFAKKHLHDECRTYMIEGPPQLPASTTLTAEVESGGNTGMLVPFLVGVATLGAFGLRKQVS
ncbi:probable (S)-N-methylcoclaurine 3'-hydroxylase isozyme 2 [Coffea arabica]|uniref:Probable (S)-N-methylcoclaurine 3'-hydroxylase isozyme 2 n=1 Tax=Coffea arabica TaxID=13443 RepID=A0ABM4WQ37_COFAR